MRYLLAIIIGAFLAQSALAEILVPVRTIRAKETITAEDLMFKNVQSPGALSDPEEVIGQEARIALYASRPIHAGDIGPPAIVDRNDLVKLVFRQGGLEITTEGRSLGRGAEGEYIRVMNLSSRTTVTGRIRADGNIEVN
ncbi:flagellar basal body P-ring formation chaperone FlgA [Tritonibacter horizontis]|uniref:Flagella basal body P-ring formation protein FlgA n=1 Tax=Tritonibacter horizontis TaxID=1768241 RepID=A0A132C2D5_9RHOB|nr:flagellar basal body P-ring formation chaperone FlgA [Tritonibacter horizontis]KUP94758.1 flagellar basal body P-ring biosynthesis protein FlgA [Tritonibacter horizontis]